MKGHRIIIFLLATVTFLSCADSSTESAADSSLNIDSAQGNPKDSVISDSEIITRRNNLVNSSEKVVKAHSNLKANVAELKKDLSNLKEKKQSDKVKEKIDLLSDKIYRKRSEYIAIEQNDIKADSVPSSKRIEYTNLLYELVKIKYQRDSYDHRDDKRADDVRSGLDEKKRVINQKINNLLK